MITLDEAIILAEEIAEENENVVNTGTFKDGWTVAEMYCDDTEGINDYLSRSAKCAEEHRQLAEWLKDYKRMLEQENWIPVNEKLPEDVGFYLVSTTDCITIMEFCKGWISQNLGSCNGYVKAWMPLPGRYKVKSEG